MIRFLQKDSLTIKIVFIAIISVAAVTMVITLVPGIFSGAYNSTSSDVYATVHSPGFLGRYFGASSQITEPEVQQVAQRMLQEQHLPDQLLPYVLPRASQALVQREVLLKEASRLGLTVTDADLTRELQTGPFAPALFPNGQFVGQDRYADFVENYFHTSIQDFETQVKKQLEIERLESAITGAVTVSDQAVRDAYLKQATKVKFDYAVISSADLRKQINPSDAELQAFFKENAARYKDAAPEERQIQYIAFRDSQIPGGEPQVTPQEISQYYQQHQKDYRVADEVKVRHILIKVPQNATPQQDAAAKQKAEDVLKQLHDGANFAELAKKYSDDSGSKAQGGELGYIQRGVTVPEFENAAFSLQPGQTSGLVKTQFGYHIIQVEDKQTAHVKPLDEVKGEILASLTRQKETQRETAYAQQLAAQAAKDGLAKTAAAHGLQAVSTGYVQASAALPGLADASPLLSAAFTAPQGAHPQTVAIGDNFAIFQVTGVKPAHEPTFEEYKAHLLEDYRQQQLPQLLARKTSELAAKARASGNLDQAAREMGATVKTSDLVDSTAQVPEIGALAQVAPQIFSLNPGQISNAINAGENGVVVKMVQKQQPSEADLAKNIDATREQLLADQREQIFAVFITDLTSRYQKQGLIQINRNAQTATTQPGLPGSPS